MKKPKERGFKYGASSRFKTEFELARKFGFVWFNEPEDEIQKIELANNSIKERRGKELFIQLIR